MSAEEKSSSSSFQAFRFLKKLRLMICQSNWQAASSFPEKPEENGRVSHTRFVHSESGEEISLSWTRVPEKMGLSPLSSGKLISYLKIEGESPVSANLLSDWLSTSDRSNMPLQFCRFGFKKEGGPFNLHSPAKLPAHFLSSKTVLPLSKKQVRALNEWTYHFADLLKDLQIDDFKAFFIGDGVQHGTFWEVNLPDPRTVDVLFLYLHNQCPRSFLSVCFADLEGTSLKITAYGSSIKSPTGFSFLWKKRPEARAFLISPHKKEAV